MNQNITKIIDQYLNDELSSNDKIAFEQKLTENTHFQAEVSLQEDIMAGAKRAAQRSEIKSIKKAYHLNKLLKWGGGVLSVITIIAAASLILIQPAENNSNYESSSNPSSAHSSMTVTSPNQVKYTPDVIEEKLAENLNIVAPIADLFIQYFKIPTEGTIVLSQQGVLLSVPENAFLKNGKPYSGAVTLQFQEAKDASDIVKSGLNTMAGDRLLETQGMFSLAGFTQKGEKLELNPAIGVYLQVPVDEYKEGMQLFTGEKSKSGNIDWVNPVPLAKIPVPIDMNQLDFFPACYEDKLDELKWTKSKKSRDSLYLSFEKGWIADLNNENIIIQPDSEELAIVVPSNKNKWERPLTKDEARFIYKKVRKGDLDRNMSRDEACILASWAEGPSSSDFKHFICEIESVAEEDVAEVASQHISPSKVLGFWNKKFNNTILSTREFERRMKAVHATCDDAVLNRYTSQLNKSITEIDAQIVTMGYANFKTFVVENVGALNSNDPHLKSLTAFYENGVQQLKKEAKLNREKELNRRKKWDNNIQKERQKEKTRKISREIQNLNEEYQFNLKNVYKQLGRSVGFKMKHGGGTVVNIDKYVMDATIARQSTTITNPFSGKTAKITYNAFTFSIPNEDKYIKLYTYLFPHQINSYQRIEGINGSFSYNLNDDIVYDIGIVGITEDGYEYFQKQTFNGGELGALQLKKVTEKELDASIKQLNKKRISRPTTITDELDWLYKERIDYKEQKMRTEMRVFRQEIRTIIFPCESLVAQE